LVIFLPHLAWLAHYDFLALGYTQGKFLVNSLFGRAGPILEPFRLLAAQAGCAAATLALWAWLYRRTPAADRGPRRRPEAFLFCAGFLPLVLLLTAVGLLGIKGGTKWAYAFLGYWPLLLFYCLPVSPPPAVRRKALILTYAVLAAFGTGVAVKNLAFPADMTNIKVRALAKTLKAEWTGAAGRPLLYVGGDANLTSFLSTYLPERPRPLWAMSARAAVWEDEKAVREAGILALARSENEYQGYRNGWPGLPPPKRLDWPFSAPLSRKTDALTIYYGVLPPGE
jgi:hypothetical protein